MRLNWPHWGQRRAVQIEEHGSGMAQVASLPALAVRRVHGNEHAAAALLRLDQIGHNVGNTPMEASGRLAVVLVRVAEKLPCHDRVTLAS